MLTESSEILAKASLECFDRNAGRERRRGVTYSVGKKPRKVVSY